MPIDAGCQLIRASTAPTGRPSSDSASGKRRLQAQHAGRGLVEGQVLELGGVRGVVGGDGVDGPVGQSGLHRVHIRLWPQGGIDLEHRVVVDRALVGQGEVVRCGLGRHGQPLGFGLAHLSDRHRGGEVEEVETGSGGPGQGDVPRHHDLLGGGGHSR